MPYTDTGDIATDFCEHLVASLQAGEVAEGWFEGVMKDWHDSTPERTARAAKNILSECPPRVMAGDLPLLFVELLEWDAENIQEAYTSLTETENLQALVMIVGMDLDHPTLQRTLRTLASKVYKWLKQDFKINGYCDFSKVTRPTFGAQVHSGTWFGTVEITVHGYKTQDYTRTP